MKIYDVSLPIHPDMPVFPGDPAVRVEPFLQIDQGDPANVSHISLGSHTGTHVDPSHHFLNDKVGIDKTPLERLVGSAQVLDMTRVRRVIRPDDLKGKLGGASRVLLKTRNSAVLRRGTFDPNYVAISPDAASYLLEAGVITVGVDALSVEPHDTGNFDTHLRLLKGGVVIIEGLDLSEVPTGNYFLACLPLKILGGDGGPARVVLIETTGFCLEDH